MRPGDEFYWRHSDDDPDVLMLIPTEVVERRYQHGERAELDMGTSAATLDDAGTKDPSVDEQAN